MHKNRLLMLCGIASIIGILIFYVYARSLGPREVDIGDISDSDVGTVVSTEGIVISITYYKGGSMHLELWDDYNTINVYFPTDASKFAKSTILSGMTIKVKGEIDIYKGLSEIIVQSKNDFEILSEFTMKKIFDMKNVFNGKNVCLRGVVFYKEIDNEGIRFKLIDEKNSEYEIICYGNNNRKNFDNGSTIRVRGNIMFEDDAAYLDCREVMDVMRR